MFANLRALAVSVAPLLFGRIYAWGNAAPGRRPGLGFWCAALFALGAEGVHQALLSVHPPEVVEKAVKNGDGKQE